MKVNHLKSVLALTSLLFCQGVAVANKAQATTKQAPTAQTQTTTTNTTTNTTATTTPAANAQPTAQTIIMSLLQEAVHFVKEHGEDDAFKVFNDPRGPFSKNNTYVFVLDFKGNMLAHGNNADLIGKNHYDLKDSKGHSVVRAIIERGRYGEGTWVNYLWKNPTTQTEECKSSYVTTVDKKFIIGAGYFHALNAKGECTNA